MNGVLYQQGTALAADTRALTVSEAAERLKLRPEALRCLLRLGRLQGTRLGGTKMGWRIPESESARVLAEGARQMDGSPR